MRPGYLELGTLLAAYAAAVAWLARKGRGGSEDFILAGRKLTTPSLVATLVATWYGGILGIGEHGWRYGICTWFFFGLPYYVAALIYAFLLAGKLRKTTASSVPELVGLSYGTGARRVSALLVLVLVLPSAYLLMLGQLVAVALGVELRVAVVVCAALTLAYLWFSGFRAVVRTDVLQAALMYAGFFLLAYASIKAVGGFAVLWRSLPPQSKSVTGGLGVQRLLVWQLLAMATLVDPAFYQRSFAAATPSVARRGVLLSVVLWFLFDSMSIGSALAARVLIPDLADPTAAYPKLAAKLLGPWPLALVWLAMLATVMSTLDSYLFLAGQAAGVDLVCCTGAEKLSTVSRVRLGMAASVAISAFFALRLRSVVEIWHVFGTVATAGLLIPVVAAALGAKLGDGASGRGAVLSMLVGSVVAVLWFLLSGEKGYLLGLEPLFPGLGASAAAWFIAARSSGKVRVGGF